VKKKEKKKKKKNQGQLQSEKGVHESSQMSGKDD